MKKSIVDWVLVSGFVLCLSLGTTRAQEEKQQAEPNGGRTSCQETVLQNFEDPAIAPKCDYGYHDVGSVHVNGTEHFFRFLYTGERWHGFKAAASPHSGYTIQVAPVRPQVDSALCFKYRSDGIHDLRLSLTLGNQNLLWFMNVVSTGEWTEVELPLAAKLTKPLDDTHVQCIHFTTFATVPSNKQSATLDMDDFVLRRSSQVPEEGYSSLEQGLRTRQECEAALRRYVRVKNLKTDKSVYSSGQSIQISYDYVNTSTNRLAIPMNNQGSKPRFLIGVTQAWIEPIDDSAKPGGIASTQGRRGAGGAITGFGKDHMLPEEQVHRQYTITVPHAGTWRYSVELKDNTGAQVNEESVEFEVGEVGKSESRDQAIFSSPNIVGYVGEETNRVESISGNVVQLSSPDNFTDSKQQKEGVTLTGVYFNGEFGRFDGERNILYDWIRPCLGGAENVIIEGKRIALSQHSFANGCLVTRDYGRLPIAFAPDGRHSITNVGYRCVLAISDEQLARLRNQLLPVSRGDMPQSGRTSTEPNKAPEDTARMLADPQP